MKKIDLGQTINTVANIGVIAGIMFLALEVRQTSNAVRTSNSHLSMELGMGIGDWLRDPNFAQVYLDVLQGSELTDVERIQFDEFLGQYMNVWEFSFNAHESGTMAEADWASWDAWFSSWIRQRSIREIWESTKRADYSGAGAFLGHIDSVLAEN